MVGITHTRPSKSLLMMIQEGLIILRFFRPSSPWTKIDQVTSGWGQTIAAKGHNERQNVNVDGP